MGTYSSNYPVRYIGASIHGLGDFKISIQRVDPDTVKWKTPTILSHLRINYHVAEKDMKKIVLGHVRRSYEFMENRDDQTDDNEEETKRSL